MWIKGGMIDRRKKNKKDIGFQCVWSMNYIIKGNVIKHQYNKIIKIKENSKSQLETKKQKKN
jgi:hypothetical protein